MTSMKYRYEILCVYTINLIKKKGMLLDCDYTSV